MQNVKRSAFADIGSHQSCLLVVVEKDELPVFEELQFADRGFSPLAKVAIEHFQCLRGKKRFVFLSEQGIALLLLLWPFQAILILLSVSAEKRDDWILLAVESLAFEFLAELGNDGYVMRLSFSSPSLVKRKMQFRDAARDGAKCLNVHFLHSAEVDEQLSEGLNFGNEVVVDLLHVEEDSLGCSAFRASEEMLDTEVHSLSVVDGEFVQNAEDWVGFLALVLVATLFVLSQSEQLRQPHHEGLDWHCFSDAHECACELLAALESRDEGKDWRKQQLCLVRLVTQCVRKCGDCQFCPLDVVVLFIGKNAQNQPVSPKWQ